jgi:cob(I)alamin adenosyltransferase
VARGKGYVIVLTGDGKGKTTCAIGMAMRAVGQGVKVAMLQFIKGSWTYGEMEIAKRLSPDFVLRPLGEGFVRVDPQNPDPRDVACAREAWEACKAVLLSGQYGMVILDELNSTVAYGLLPVEEVLDVLPRRPEHVHVVITGRDAHPAVVELADLVTEMKEIKHPYQQGHRARKGIEY